MSEVRANSDFLVVDCERQREMRRATDDHKDFGLMADARGCGQSMDGLEVRAESLSY